MGDVKCEVSIHAPVDEVFRRLTDFGSLAEIVSGITKVDVLTEGPTAIGTRFCETRVIFGKTATETMEVTAMEAPRMIELSAESCGNHYRTVHTFEPTGEGETLVKLNMHSTPMTTGAKIMGAVMTPLMKGTMRKLLENDMADLKRACERSAGGDD